MGTVEIVIKTVHRAAGVSREDLDTLRPGEWVNDRIISAYLEMLLENREKRNILVFNSFFYVSLTLRGNVFVDRQWMDRDIFLYDKVVVPLFLHSHWSLGCIDNRRRRVTVYDSLRPFHRECAEKLRGFVEYQSIRRRGRVVEYSAVYSLKTVQQKNCSDCGVFLLLFARRILLEEGGFLTGKRHLKTGTRAQRGFTFRGHLVKEIVEGRVREMR